MYAGLQYIVDGDRVHFSAPCVITGKVHSVTAPKSGVDAYLNGALMQDAFPGLNSDEREFLISGISPEGWGATFPQE